MKRWMFLFLLVIGKFAFAQQKDSLVSGSYQDATLEALVQDLESKTAYIFYYDSAQLSGTRINVSFRQVPMARALELAFRNSAIYFSMDPHSRIFLTKNFRIATRLLLPTDVSDTAKTADLNSLATANEKKAVASENRLFEIGSKTSNLSGNALITGYVRHARTGEPVTGVSITDERLQSGTMTDAYGFYSLTLPKGGRSLMVQGMGMKEAKYQLMVYADGKLDIELQDRIISLKEVIITSQKPANTSRVPMGVERLTIQAIKQMPVVFGEADILRAVLTVPGVKTVGEASTGFNVRGGSADQNLILLNESTIYNPSHFFGIFSAFNPDVVKDIELYKSSIPAQYGGRLSSVLDIRTREGNKKEFSGVAGLGLITSRLTVEGPIKKDQTSFIAGVRSTYANWLLKMLPESYHDSKASFHDANLHISHRMGSKDDIYLSGYVSNDRFNLSRDTTYRYSNRNAAVKWKHTFNKRLNGVLTMGYDQYRFSLQSDKNPINAYRLSMNLQQLHFKTAFNLYISPKHTVDFGMNGIRYQISPGTFEAIGNESLVVPEIMQTEQALEHGYYISDRFTVTDRLAIHAGLRYSVYHFLGPQRMNLYTPGMPRETDNILETKDFRKGTFIKTYHAPEYRASLRYAFSDYASVKAAYNVTRQYIHMISNTTAIAPTDIWKLSDPNIRPQQGTQYSAGYYQNLKGTNIEISLELYYRKIRDYLDYKPGASLVLNPHLETDVLNTKGKAYGVEWMLKKQTGKLNGWISYTWSRILLQVDDPAVASPVNNGAWYPANYDKPHDVTLIGNFRVNHRFSLSANVTYSTGRPITLPIGRYYYNGSQRALYSDRNAYRIPDYFRTDFSMNIDGNHKVKQRTHNSWTIGVYNVTARKNPYSVYFVSENGVIKGYKLSIFGSMIPFINFNIRW